MYVQKINTNSQLVQPLLEVSGKAVHLCGHLVSPDNFKW